MAARNGGTQNTGGTAIAPTPIASGPPPKKQEIKDVLESRKAAIAEIIPSFMTAERVVRLATLAIYKNPDLLKCTPASILQAVMEASALGLEIGGPLAQAHLVPYGNTCQFVPDYKGLLSLARRTGEFDLIEAREVYASDTFRLRYTPSAEFLHEPDLDSDDPGKIVRVYAYAKLKTGDMAFEIMTHAQVEKIRAGSRAANRPAWRGHWGEMAKKTCLKRLLKRQARSVELAKAIAADDHEYIDTTASVAGQPRLPGVSSSQQLAHQLGAPVAEPVFMEGTAGAIRSEPEPPDVEPGDDLAEGAGDADDRELGCDDDR